MNDERAFLIAILERPADDTTKLVYADWLEEQGDPRGEFLRLAVKVRQERVITPEQRQRHNELSAELTAHNTQVAEAVRARRFSSQEDRERRRRVHELEDELTELSKQMRQRIPTRLQELAATFDPNWLAVVSDPEIALCGKIATESWRLQFNYVCDKTWADLEPTEKNDFVRLCETCGKNVYFCENLADARQHSVVGHCIAVDLGIIRRDGDLVSRNAIMGDTAFSDFRKPYEEDMDSVSQARLEERKQAGHTRKHYSGDWAQDQ
jgi:uncharacterized protein (TIGR02996 family)